MEHLGCFIPAMLALGVNQGAVNGTKADQYMTLAADLTYTCWKMYDSQYTGEACRNPAPANTMHNWRTGLKGGALVHIEVRSTCISYMSPSWQEHRRMPVHRVGMHHSFYLQYRLCAVVGKTSQQSLSLPVR